MAINVPQITPNPVQFQPPDALVQGYLNRPNSAMVASNSLSQSIGALAQYQQYKQSKQLEALKAISELYGAGGPGAVQQYGPTINRATGTNIIDTNQGAPQGAPQGAAPSSYTPPSGGGMLPSNATATPQASAQTMPNQSQGSSVLNDPAIASHSTNIGWDPDFYNKQLQGVQQKMQGLENQGKYGTTQQEGLAKEVPIITARMNAAAEESRFQRGQQAEEERFQRGKGAEIVTKEGDISSLMNDANKAFQRLDNRLSAYHQSGASLGSSNLAKVTGGRAGSAVGDAAMGDAKHLILVINKLLIGRFQMSGDQLLSDAMAPSPNYTPAKNAQLMRDLNDTLDAIKSGRTENVKNVVGILRGNNAQ